MSVLVEGGRKSFMGTTAQQKMKIRLGLELKLYFIAELYLLSDCTEKGVDCKL